MKNNFYNIFITTFVIFFYANLLYGSELNVLSSEIKIEKNSKVIVLKGNVTATDDKNNKLYTDSGTYEKKKNIAINITWLNYLALHTQVTIKKSKLLSFVLSYINSGAVGIIIAVTLKLSYNFSSNGNILP